MLGAFEQATKEIEVKEANQAMEMADVTEPAALPELAPQVVEAMRKVQKSMYFVYFFNNFDLGELVDERDLANGNSL